MIIRTRLREVFQQPGLITTCLAADAGQALVELALTMPILLLILVGAAELSRVAYAAIEVANAAKAGVQYASYSRANAVNTAGIQAAAVNESPDITLTTTPSVGYACSCSNGTATTCSSGLTTCSTSSVEQTVTVTTQTDFDPLFHLPGLPTTYNLHGSASQKVINQ